MTDHVNPFHAGELAAQDRAGAKDVADWAGGFIRDYLPQQHRDFYRSLPFLVMAGADHKGRMWVTLVDGDDGFIAAPDAQHLTLDTLIDSRDPLAKTFAQGTEIGAVGIELGSRRRNRFSGKLHATPSGLSVEVRQSFGNCPQYISQRVWSRAPKAAMSPAVHRTALDPSQIRWIETADTMFIGSGHEGNPDHPSHGFDASHRGGPSGFVQVTAPDRLRIPDYAGNNFFNTIGNLLADPRIGIVFVDFDTGSLLHITGHAHIEWAPSATDEPEARRIIEIEICAVVERPGAIGLRWAKQETLSRQFSVTRRVRETNEITSFYLAPSDGAHAAPFEAGQHLPIEVQIPGQTGSAKRTYSLSGPPDAKDGYRLSIKREPHGLVSRFLHDDVQIGDTVQASPPAGDFVIPCSTCPLVLVSAGVGLTPMVSMLHAVVRQSTERPVWFVHGARGGQDYAMSQEIADLVGRRTHARQITFYSRPEPEDTLGEQFDVAGRIDAKTLLTLGAGSGAHYMLCGPAQFLASIRSGLEAAGVQPDMIHFETFGPTG
ncbi:pyridoxamine 5'-phosphate oxidase family protein [Roseobacter litoralis]|uniref:FAD-binding oxidoreductase n=1 Tax=Roseobacter litoralis TaxID=42443 RepID=UPI0024954DAA|nr:pyridoxamine 5'-phosphate oxidase family protein [Roseobacter litoralis]